MSDIVRYLREVAARPGNASVRHVNTAAITQATDEIERLRRERAAVLASVVLLSNWQTRAANILGEILDDIDPDDTERSQSPWTDVIDLLIEAYVDNEGEAS